MARVLFIHPPRLRRIGRDFAFKELLPHIGLAYVAASTRRAGHECAVIDAAATGESIRQIVLTAAQFNPDLIAFTANTYQIGEAARTASALKEALPRVPIALGGYHVTPLPEQTLREFPMFDAAVFGEAEASFLDLLNALPLENLASPLAAGLAFRSGSEIRVGPERPLDRGLDSLPFPAFDLMPLPLYDGMYRIRRNPALSISTARGCPYRCIFCQNPGGTQYRYRSMESVMEEIDYDLRTYSIRQLVLTDETFTLNRKRTTRFCETMMERGFHRQVRWVCETRVDAVTRDLLQLLKDSGCEAISFGVEAGNQDVLDGIKKKTVKEEAIQAVRWCREVGIFTQTNFIIGHPYETQDTIKDTIQLALDLQGDSAGFSILVPFPGTEVARMAERGEGGLRLLTRDWAQFGKQIGAALELENVRRPALERLRLAAYLRFYLRPRQFPNAFRVAHMGAVPFFLSNVLVSQVKGLFNGGSSRPAVQTAQ